MKPYAFWPDVHQSTGCSPEVESRRSRLSRQALWAGWEKRRSEYAFWKRRRRRIDKQRLRTAVSSLE